jgi:hypothetical protein
MYLVRTREYKSYLQGTAKYNIKVTGMELLNIKITDRKPLNIKVTGRELLTVQYRFHPLLRHVRTRLIQTSLSAVLIRFNCNMYLLLII